MKLILIVALLLPAPVWASIAPDKESHLNLSLALGLASYSALRAAGEDKKNALYISIGFSLGLGFMKELGTEKFDSEDLAYDAAGVGLGVSIPLIVESF